MQAFSTPSDSHGNDRYFTEANGAFQARTDWRTQRASHREGKPRERRMLAKPFSKFTDLSNNIADTEQNSKISTSSLRHRFAIVTDTDSAEANGMRTIWLFGGMSWESTAVYYRRINESVRDRLGGLQ